MHLGVHVIAAGDNSRERRNWSLCCSLPPRFLRRPGPVNNSVKSAAGRPGSGTIFRSPLSAYARSGLEGIPDPSAAQALRTACGDLKGRLLAGVINSLGVRDADSVDALRPLAENPASGVAKEDLSPLGRIDTRTSIVSSCGMRFNAAPTRPAPTPRRAVCWRRKDSLPTATRTRRSSSTRKLDVQTCRPDFMARQRGVQSWRKSRTGFRS